MRAFWWMLSAVYMCFSLYESLAKSDYAEASFWLVFSFYARYMSDRAEAKP